MTQRVDPRAGAVSLGPHAGEGGPWGSRRWVPILFGVGWALVLDESALIISLADVYWEPLGDLSYWIMGTFALAMLIAAIWAPERDRN